MHVGALLLLTVFVLFVVCVFVRVLYGACRGSVFVVYSEVFVYALRVFVHVCFCKSVCIVCEYVCIVFARV